MARVVLTVELLPALDKVWATLESECSDPVTMQKVLELAVTRYVCKMGNHTEAAFVARHMNKHVQQLVSQMFE
jgi:hypothetical protein